MRLIYLINWRAGQNPHVYVCVMTASVGGWGVVVRRCDVFCFTQQREQLDHRCIPSPSPNLMAEALL